MTDQVGTDLRSGAGTVEGTRSDITPATPGHYEPFHGRPVSWVAVSIINGGVPDRRPGPRLRPDLVAVLGWPGRGRDRRPARRVHQQSFEDWY